MDSLTIKAQSLDLLLAADAQTNIAVAERLRYQAAVLRAQAEHLDRTGHYIDLPGSMIGQSNR